MAVRTTTRGGASLAAARPFTVAFVTAATTGVAIARGAYDLRADQACVVELGPVGVAANALNATTQPAAVHAAYQLAANETVCIEVGSDGLYLSAIRVSADGTLVVNGPLRPVAT
jgi:hypothetical protein